MTKKTNKNQSEYNEQAEVANDSHVDDQTTEDNIGSADATCVQDDNSDTVSEQASTDSGEETANEVAELKKSLAELSDKHMRLMAEYDNFRRRSKQEKLDLYDTSLSDVVCDWLPVIDNLERAISAADQVSGEDKASQVQEGIELIYRQALQVLEKQGVKEIEALGATFDPNIHEAVMHVEDDQYDTQEIVEVFQKGYKREDKVLRYSIVKVAN
ncbi:MAG: nucleotide exchange factor GrpE [Fastidiosipilaceae bacterium]|nr:nucleotide exchange factor GrpE [Clostridiaceae bacterium]